MTLGTFVSRLVCTVKLMIMVVQNGSTAAEKAGQGKDSRRGDEKDKRVRSVRVAARYPVSVLKRRQVKMRIDERQS